MGSVTGELSTLLPPEAGSVGRARHLVSESMTASGHQDLVDVATLLVSEVVTNAVLHAGTDIRLTCRQSRAGVRVEVFDRSPLLPTVRHYDAEATTGRGLDLVSALAARWGIDCAEDGKTLWFELGDGSGGHEERPSTDVVAESGPEPDGAFEVHLCGASPHLLRAVIEHGDALVRELALLALGGELEDALQEGWHLPQFDVSQILAAAEAAAVTAPEARADLKLHLPAGADTAASERLRLVDHADALARDGRLLSAPALPEVAVCRHWLYTQIAGQAAGFAPQVWELSEPLEPVRVAAALPPGELERLERTAAATIVADDANRIIFVNQAAGELLGWTPGALIGQRLTVLIPAELREAHLAGFSRLQVTGKPRILGSMLHLPALRRDGSCVEVALMIEQLADLGRRSAFRAVLAATGEDGRGRSPVPYPLPPCGPDLRLAGGCCRRVMRPR
ncbi:MAG: PAS domain S-box protein [Actinomycetota bacterium]|nr:PAS domain S-box protein [Actinomycetota bacterium]